MTAPSTSYIAVSGKTRDIAFLVGVLRARKIPYRQAPAFAHAPILKIPLEYTAQLEAIIEKNREQHPITKVSDDELKETRDMFWIMVAAAVGILLIAWVRYFIRWLH